MTFDDLPLWGLAIVAVSGIAALIAGLALKPTLANLFARLQIAMDSPIRVGDKLMTESECGSVERITATHVVLRLVDKRELLIPTRYFLHHPFQNLTRQNVQFATSITLHAYHSAPIDRVRAHFRRVVVDSEKWDCRVAELQVAKAKPRDVELRCVVSAANATDLADLRCEVREKMVAYLQTLPRTRPREQFDFTSFSFPPDRLETERAKGRGR